MKQPSACLKRRNRRHELSCEEGSRRRWRQACKGAKPARPPAPRRKGQRPSQQTGRSNAFPARIQPRSCDPGRPCEITGLDSRYLNGCTDGGCIQNDLRQPSSSGRTREVTGPAGWRRAKRRAFWSAPRPAAGDRRLTIGDRRAASPSCPSLSRRMVPSTSSTLQNMLPYQLIPRGCFKRAAPASSGIWSADEPR